MKYTDTMVTFSEVPDEISLCINISNCPIHCKDCHSKELWGDVGSFFNLEVLVSLIQKNDGITCICFMGGDLCPTEIMFFCQYIKKHFPELKTAWYSGRDNLSDVKHVFKYLDYIKIGPYIEKYGPLNKETTNQRMYKIENNGDTLTDITKNFLKKN